jgi:hypothetical protein
MNTIARMWIHSEMCSHNPTGGERLFRGAIFSPYENSLDAGYIAEYESEIIISFRGTDGLDGWASDFDAYPLEDGGIIHDGFYDGWEPFKIEVDRYLRASFGITGNDFSGIAKAVYCTGHSRGGALATLCARHLAKNRRLPCSCISFGAPAQGLAKYRDEFDLLPINHSRVVHGYDIVPTMPPAAFGFRHCGRLLHLAAPAWHRLPWMRVRDHFYSSYTRALINYSNQKMQCEN